MEEVSQFISLNMDTWYVFKGSLKLIHDYICLIFVFLLEVMEDLDTRSHGGDGPMATVTNLLGARTNHHLASNLSIVLFAF